MGGSRRTLARRWAGAPARSLDTSSVHTCASPLLLMRQAGQACRRAAIYPSSTRQGIANGRAPSVTTGGAAPPGPHAEHGSWLAFGGWHSLDLLSAIAVLSYNRRTPPYPEVNNGNEAFVSKTGMADHAAAAWASVRQSSGAPEARQATILSHNTLLPAPPAAARV